MFQEPSCLFFILWWTSIVILAMVHSGSVNLLTTNKLSQGTVLTVSFLPMIPQHSTEEEEVKHTLSHWPKQKKEIDGDGMVESTTAAIASTSPVCVCVRSFRYVSRSSPSTSLPCSFPPQAASLLLYEWELLQLSPQDTLQCLNVSICGGSDTHSLTLQGTYP